MSKTILTVEGVSCPSCIEHLNKALAIGGVSNVDVRVEEGVIAVDHDATVSAGALISAVEKAGYAATLQPAS